LKQPFPVDVVIGIEKLEKQAVNSSKLNRN